MSSKHFFKKTKKNTSGNERKSKSPKNSRTFPDIFSRFPHPTKGGFLKLYVTSLKIFVILIFLLAAIIVGMDLRKNILAKQGLDLQREKAIRELKYWKSFIEKNKDFKDAYFQLSVLEYKMGNMSEAKKYVEKGLALDPNSEDGRKIKEYLNK